MPTIAPYDFGHYIEAAGFLDGHACFVSVEGYIHLFLQSGEMKIEAHDGLACASFSSNQKTLITGGEDGIILKINPQGETEQLADLGGQWINAVSTSPNGAIGWAAGKQAFALSNGKISQFSHDNTVEDIAFAPKGLRLATARYNGADIHWVGTEAAANFYHWAGPHQMVAFSPDGKYLITSMQENSLHGWRLADGQDLRMSGYPTKIKSMSFSAKGKWLATSGANSAVLWPFQGKDGPIGKMPKELGHRADAMVVQVACHPKQDLVAIGYHDGMILLVKLDDGQELLLRRPKEKPSKCSITSMSWCVEGNQIAFGAENGEAGVIDLTS